MIKSIKLRVGGYDEQRDDEPFSAIASQQNIELGDAQFFSSNTGPESNERRTVFHLKKQIQSL